MLIANSGQLGSLTKPNKLNLGSSSAGLLLFRLQLWMGSLEKWKDLKVGTAISTEKNKANMSFTVQSYTYLFKSQACPFERDFTLKKYAWESKWGKWREVMDDPSLPKPCSSCGSGQDDTPPPKRSRLGKLRPETEVQDSPWAKADDS